MISVSKVNIRHCDQWPSNNIVRWNKIHSNQNQTQNLLSHGAGGLYYVQFIKYASFAQWALSNVLRYGLGNVDTV